MTSLADKERNRNNTSDRLQEGALPLSVNCRCQLVHSGQATRCTPALVLVVHKRIDEVTHNTRKQDIAQVAHSFVVVSLCVSLDVRLTVLDLDPRQLARLSNNSDVHDLRHLPQLDESANACNARVLPACDSP
jgi:hypothetical protein